MKKTIFLSTLLLFTFAIFSCSKKEDSASNTLTETPAAKASYDGSNFGVYKGVFVGSSGTISIDISNSGTLTATLKIDGITYNFTTTQTIQLNQQTTLTFTSGSNSFTFTVSANGLNPIITNLIMNGHNDPALVVVKEISTALVKCYVGNFAGGDHGVFNAVIYNGKMKAILKSLVANANYFADGTITNNQIVGTVSTGTTFSGTLNGDNFSGTWTNGQSALNGTWTGKRTF